MDGPTKDPHSFGIFETIKVNITHSAMAISFFERHLKRAQQSARALNIPNSHPIFDRNHVIEQVKNMRSSLTLEQSCEYYRLRLSVLKDDLLYTLTPYTNRFPNSDAKLFPVAATRDNPSLKSISAPVSLNAQEVALSASCNEALLVDACGYIREGAWTNFFWLDANLDIYTPETNVLPGIIREVLMEERVSLKEIALHDIEKLCHGAFITNAMNNIVPVVSIGEFSLAIPIVIWEISNYLEQRAKEEVLYIHDS